MIIVTDDQRATMEGLPRTRAFFEYEGRAYPNAFATTPMCCPSRASIMTGRYAHNHTVHHNAVTDDFPINETLQAKVQAAGYTTGLFGKYLNRWPIDVSPPHFDSFAVSNFGYVDRAWNVNGIVDTVPGYNTDIVGDKAVDFIEANRSSNKPWLMYVTPFAPHSSYVAEPAYADAPAPYYGGNPAMWEQDRRDKPPFIQAATRSYRTGLRTREKQLRTLYSVDDLVARLAGELRRNGEENTIAIFLSDNGLLWAEHGVIGKKVPYTAAVKIPMYLRWPGVVDPGTVDPRLVGNIDVMPTLLQAARASGGGAGSVDGRDLLDPAWTRNRLLLEFSCVQPTSDCHAWASTRTSQYQYTEYYDADGRASFREYYDLRNDPWQLTNLYRDRDPSTHPPIRPLRDQLHQDRDCAGTEASSSSGVAACP